MTALVYKYSGERRWGRMDKAIVQWYHNEFGSYRVYPMFDGIELSEGGFLVGNKWMTSKELRQARERWVNHSYATALPEAVTKGGAYQCGGCRFFGAFDNDYGLCCNSDSPNDGRVVFEHGGCLKHSYVVSLEEKVGKE